MELTDIKLKNVKYYLNTCTVQAGSKSFDVPRAMVQSIQIDNNYDNAIYPFFYIAINLPSWMYVEVSKNPKNLFITLDLKETFFQDNIEEKNLPMVQAYRGRYVAISAIDTPVTDLDTQTKISKDNNTYEKNYDFSEVYLTEFMLYNVSSYNALSTVVNSVITSANMTSIVTHVLGAGGIKNILMTPLNNTKSYSEFKVTPIDAVDQMKHLISKYGLHTKGTVFFMDLDKAFLVDKSVKCTAWYTGEYKTTHIMSFGNYNDGISKFSGYYSNTKEKYHLLGIQPDSIQASELETVPNIQTQHQNKNTLEIFTDSAIMEAFSPNKEIIVNIDTPTAKNVNGSYRTSRIEVRLTPSGEYFDPQFKITLLK